MTEIMDSTSHMSQILRWKICVCKFLKKQFSAIFYGSFAGQGFLNKDPTVWLDGARPANTCIPPSFLESVLTQPRGVPTNKIRLQVYETECLQV